MQSMFRKKVLGNFINDGYDIVANLARGAEFCRAHFEKDIQLKPHILSWSLFTTF
jgi:hypothetical protein